jgi:DNA integrity scanning protein DisA with diadenylate cyclase activity
MFMFLIFVFLFLVKAQAQFLFFRFMFLFLFLCFRTKIRKFLEKVKNFNRRVLTAQRKISVKTFEKVHREQS